MSQVVIDGREADKREAEILRKLVQEKCADKRAWDAPIIHLTWEHAKKIARERGLW